MLFIQSSPFTGPFWAMWYCYVNTVQPGKQYYGDSIYFEVYFIIAGMNVIYLMWFRLENDTHCGAFVMGAGWSNLFNFGFHTSGDEKRSELIYVVAGPSRDPSPVLGCYGQSDLQSLWFWGLKQYFFFLLRSMYLDLCIVAVFYLCLQVINKFVDSFISSYK